MLINELPCFTQTKHYYIKSSVMKNQVSSYKTSKNQ